MKVEFLILLPLNILIFSPASIWCEQESSEDKSECKDTSPLCYSLLKINPDLCNGYQTKYFARVCKKSCGLCASIKLENKLKAQTEMLNEMLNEIQTQRDELNTKLEKMIKTMASNNKRHDKLIAELKMKNSELTNKVGDLTKKKNGLTYQVTDLIEKVTRITKKDVGITKEIADLKEKQNSPIAFKTHKSWRTYDYTGIVSVWSTTDFNFFEQGGAFNASSGVFTAPSDGLYAFNFFIGIFSSNSVDIQIRHNGVTVSWVKAKDDDDFDNSSNSIVLEMKKQDTVHLHVNSLKYTNKWTNFFFSGYRVTKT